MLYDAEEDTLLLELLREHGCKWGIIKEQFNSEINRSKIYTEAMLRNRYYRIAKQKGTQRNKCTKCGQMTRSHTCGIMKYHAVKVKLRGFLIASEFDNTVDIDALITDVETSFLSKMQPLTHFDEMTEGVCSDLSDEDSQMLEEYFFDKRPLQMV